jgi:hypothetical protein
MGIPGPNARPAAEREGRNQRTFQGGYMQQFEFSSEEQGVMAELLRHQIQELDVEVGRTDTHDFKAKLKHRRHVLETVLAKLSNQPIAV